MEGRRRAPAKTCGSLLGEATAPASATAAARCGAWPICCLLVDGLQIYFFGVLLLGFLEPTTAAAVLFVA